MEVDWRKKMGREQQVCVCVTVSVCACAHACVCTYASMGKVREHSSSMENCMMTSG